MDYVLVRQKGPAVLIRSSQGNVSEIEISTGSPSLLGRAFLALLPKEPGLYAATARYVKGLQRPLCKVGKRIDLAKEIASLRGRTSFTPAHTGSPGISGFAHRADASAAMQAYRARENEKKADILESIARGFRGPVDDEAASELEGAFFETANEMGYSVSSEARDLLERAAELIVSGDEDEE
jgi:hypothetical protein